MVLIIAYICIILVAQPERVCLPTQEMRFSPWVGKIPWRWKRQHTPVFLPRKPHGQRSLAGLQSTGSQTSGFQTSLSTGTTQRASFSHTYFKQHQPCFYWGWGEGGGRASFFFPGVELPSLPDPGPPRAEPPAEI